MITPPYLKPGDKVAIVAPAKNISAERIDNAIQILTSWGLEVSTGRHVLGSFNYFSGTDEERAADFQEALDDEKIRAVFCARGGYGTVRIIDQLNFERFRNNPKWIIGYSDITVLHSHVNHLLETETIHAPMPLDYPVDNRENNPGLQSLKQALFGEDLAFADDDGEALNRDGDAVATLTGGNISVLLSLLGSESEMDTKDKILFIEDIGESMYHLDRMMQTLKRAGKLSGLKGLIVGHLTNFTDNNNQYAFNKSAKEIIKEAVEEYDYPVCFNFKAGHEKDSVSLIMGRQIQINVNQYQSHISFINQQLRAGKNKLIKRILGSAFSIFLLFAVIYLIYFLAVKYLL